MPYHLLGDWVWDYVTLPALGLVSAIYLIKKSFDAKAAHQQWVLSVEHVGRFVDECCVLGSDEECTSNDLYQRYQDWANKEGVFRRLCKNDFVKRMESQNAGVMPYRNAHEHGFKGIGLMNHAGTSTNTSLH